MNRYIYVLMPLLFLSHLLLAQVPLMNSHPSAAATIFLDFDGHTVTGTSWNYTSVIECAPSGLDNTKITEVFNRVAEDYRPFNINITTDSAKYIAAPADRRMRVIITVSSAWYGSAGGVAYVGSFTWGDATPCFVFSALLSYNTKIISEAISHECGHTLGLYHQSSYNTNCVKTSDYNSGGGSGETGWAPIMGIGYYQNFTVWHDGPNSYGCNTFQNDKAVIAATLGTDGMRNDDHNNQFGTASQMIFQDNQFSVAGLIEANSVSTSDSDLYKFIIPASRHLTLTAIPYNMGDNNAGSNLDINLTLFNSNEQVIRSYNPDALLGAYIDTILGEGIYYLRIYGTGNSYASNYGSLGGYTITAVLSTSTVLPLHKLELKGKLNNGKHELTWIIVADEQVTDQQIQVSYDRINFTEAVIVHTQNRSLFYTPVFSLKAWYRLKIILDNGKTHFSNIVMIDTPASLSWPGLVSTLVSNDCSVNSPGNFSYSIYSSSGQMHSKGHLQKGTTLIKTTGLMKGIYLISYNSLQGSYSEKFLIQ